MHSKDSDQTRHPPTAGWSESSLGSHANSLVLSRRASNMAELFWEMTQWKIFISGWVQVLDFATSLVYSNCQNDRKCCCFLFFLSFFLYVPWMRFITYRFVYHFGRIWFFASIFVKKDPLEYSIQSLKTADAVLLSLFMRDNGICDIPHAGYCL